MEKSPKPSKQTATSPDLVKLFEEAYAKKNPHLPPLDRGKALKRIRDTLSMLDYLRQWTKATPGNELAWYGLGLAYGELGRYPEAIAAYRMALRLKPDDTKVWKYLGVAYGKMGRHRNKIEAYREALRIKPDFADAWYNLGATYANSGNRTAALEAVKELRRYDPQGAEKLFNLIMKP